MTCNFLYFRAFLKITIPFYRLGTSDAKLIVMVARRTVLTSLTEAACSRVATALHWETVGLDQVGGKLCQDKDQQENKEDKVVYQPKLGDLEIPNTLKSEIKRFL